MGCREGGEGKAKGATGVGWGLTVGRGPVGGELRIASGSEGGDGPAPSRLDRMRRNKKLEELFVQVCLPGSPSCQMSGMKGIGGAYWGSLLGEPIGGAYWGRSLLGQTDANCPPPPRHPPLAQDNAKEELVECH